MNFSFLFCFCLFVYCFWFVDGSMCKELRRRARRDMIGVVVVLVFKLILIAGCFSSWGGVYTGDGGITGFSMKPEVFLVSNRCI